jgi:hypothetical protein
MRSGTKADWACARGPLWKGGSAAILDYKRSRIVQMAAMGRPNVIMLTFQLKAYTPAHRTLIYCRKYGHWKGTFSAQKLPFQCPYFYLGIDYRSLCFFCHADFATFALLTVPFFVLTNVPFRPGYCASFVLLAVPLLSSLLGHFCPS